MKRGAMYFDADEHNQRRLMYCVGYCPDCKKKIGVTSEQLSEIYLGMPNKWQEFWYKLSHIRIVIG